MADAVVTPLISSPLIDSNGTVTREWYMFFSAIVQILGGAPGVPLPPGTVTIVELQAVSDDLPPPDPRIKQLTAELQALIAMTKFPHDVKRLAQQVEQLVGNLAEQNQVLTARLKKAELKINEIENRL